MEDGKITAENTPYKIGEELKQNSMFAALPTPTKIYYSLGNNSGNCPITICDGHKSVSYTHLDVYKRQVFTTDFNEIFQTEKC